MKSHDLALSFLQEAEDLLAEIESAALSLSSKNSDMEVVNHLFRAFHTIKGSGSMFGFTQVASFTHHIETLLDQVREGTVPVTDHLPSVILAAADQIKLLLNASQTGTQVDLGLQAVLLETVQQMTQPTAIVEDTHKPKPSSQEQALPAWNIKFRPNEALLATGGNPFLLFRDLKRLGACIIHGHSEDVPALTELNPELCHFWWTIELIGSCTESDIRDVFMFAEDGSDLEIKSAGQVSAAVLSTPPAETPKAGYAEAASVQDAVILPPRLQSSGVESPATNKTAGVASPDQAASSNPAGREATVRVPAARLDRLVNLVGELVMNQSRLARAAAPLQAPELAGPVEEIDRLVSELRDDVLQIRMMPIGTIFGRFRRLVRDLSLQLGKEIDLVTEGEDTELDKSILDQLSEPLVHLLRNSIDHGIESSAVRTAAGKPGRGVIRLIATHRGSDVVVSIQDDGAGLNREAIKAKAIAKQLIPADANLTDKEIMNLILLPGFSTAASITSVSGRGVGMDVVKRQIDVLRGSLNISSELGKGTSISLTLPLTLAIIDGLLVETGDTQYIIPMAAVTENVELRDSERLMNNGRNMIPVRGELIPYIDLRQLFNTEGTPPSICKIVLVQYEDQRVGFVVDRVVGTYQTVIQAMGRFFRHIGVVSGSTIMGDGRVALILDIAAIVRLATRNGSVALQGQVEGDLRAA